MASLDLEVFQEKLTAIIQCLDGIDEDEKISALNTLKIALHKVSPFREEPVDCVVWINCEEVLANNYNPNTVAPPEMELLKLSIEEDGYTQPIVAFPEHDAFTVIDGFHRNRVGREYPHIKERLRGYLPITIIKKDREGLDDRMASTIRHNRARGKHGVESMSKIVLELSRRNWSDQKIAKHLGMDADEVLRLKQISGLAEMFAHTEFSEAWDINEEALT